MNGVQLTLRTDWLYLVADKWILVSEEANVFQAEL